MQHSPPVFLPEGKSSTAFYSLSGPKRLVVFVHGFSGVSLGTWNNFAAIMQSDSSFADCDLLFYGYDSLKGQAYAHSCWWPTPLAPSSPGLLYWTPLLQNRPGEQNAACYYLRPPTAVPEYKIS